MLDHEECRESRQNYLPTRLLDLQAFQGSADVRLVALKLEHPEAEYITLSHCWGPPARYPITSRKDTLEQRMTRISFDHLPQTFQDAVSITRKFSLRYLWIDSLCIIQDDEEDRAREAAAMAKVYGGSLCTLSALNAEDSTKGFRIHADVQDFGSYVDLDFGLPRVRVFADEPRDWHSTFGDDPFRPGEYGRKPLTKRAWTLQERELSIRNIHFAGDLILWECLETKGSNQLPWHHKTPEDDFQPWLMRNDPTESLLPGIGPVSLRDRWYELMEDYSSRSLTKEKDKLPALPGLASKFKEHFPTGQYLVGLWSNHLPSALLWKTTTDRRGYQTHSVRRLTSYIAPSWSWASLDGGVTFESQRLEGGNLERPKESAADYDFEDLIVDSTDIQPKGVDPFGEILSASLVLRGAVVSVNHRPIETKYRQDSTGLRAIIGKDGADVGVFYPDIINEVLDADPIFCLSVRSEPSEPQISMPQELYENDSPEQIGGLIMGLALVQGRANRGTFQRVGLVRWVRKSIFASIEPSVITLI